MNKVTLYYNPRCGNCRKAEELLKQNGIEIELIRYLEQPPDRKTLSHLLEILSDPPAALLRAKEKQFLEAGLDPDRTWTAA